MKLITYSIITERHICKDGTKRLAGYEIVAIYDNKIEAEIAFHKEVIGVLEYSQLDDEGFSPKLTKIQRRAYSEGMSNVVSESVILTHDTYEEKIIIKLVFKP